MQSFENDATTTTNYSNYLDTQTIDENVFVLTGPEQFQVSFGVIIFGNIQIKNIELNRPSTKELTA